MPGKLLRIKDRTGFLSEYINNDKFFLGGDTDTIAAIAGAMAEAYFGMSIQLKDECHNRLERGMLEVIRRFVANC